MVFKFEKATKEKAKLRAALFGPSGSGKTFSALRIATGLGRKIAVIDTERGRARKYADIFEFDLLLEINHAHVASVIKDSTGGKFQDKMIEKPG